MVDRVYVSIVPMCKLNGKNYLNALSEELSKQGRLSKGKIRKCY